MNLWSVKFRLSLAILKTHSTCYAPPSFSLKVIGLDGTLGLLVSLGGNPTYTEGYGPSLAVDHYTLVAVAANLIKKK